MLGPDGQPLHAAPPERAPNQMDTRVVVMWGSLWLSARPLQKRMVTVFSPPNPNNDQGFIFCLSTVSIILQVAQRPAKMPYILCVYVCALVFRHTSTMLIAAYGWTDASGSGAPREKGIDSLCISTRESTRSSGGSPRRTCPGFKHLSEQLPFQSVLAACLQLIYAFT